MLARSCWDFVFINLARVDASRSKTGFEVSVVGAGVSKSSVLAGDRSINMGSQNQGRQCRVILSHEVAFGMGFLNCRRWKIDCALYRGRRDLGLDKSVDPMRTGSEGPQGELKVRSQAARSSRPRIRGLTPTDGFKGVHAAGSGLSSLFRH